MLTRMMNKKKLLFSCWCTRAHTTQQPLRQVYLVQHARFRTQFKYLSEWWFSVIRRAPTIHTSLCTVLLCCSCIRSPMMHKFARFWWHTRAFNMVILLANTSIPFLPSPTFLPLFSLRFVHCSHLAPVQHSVDVVCVLCTQIGKMWCEFITSVEFINNFIVVSFAHWSNISKLPNRIRCHHHFSMQSNDKWEKNANQWLCCRRFPCIFLFNCS